MLLGLMNNLVTCETEEPKINHLPSPQSLCEFTPPAPCATPR